ncbi:hypothetical protein DPSP01_001648 [Paraphaeosphaeria sporulosa]|uniref:Uncharacterized protein n=1 Tax=Paraphaeosphaeria sporulosa TaxID=1460663 RepID=A0A177CSD6_9PLEO|nr:uncharacterized protein CC84DRAFT_1236227 [Paraphaeosphaeria sporulosa]OAG10111.1 hypothetical protein CC84DRAFT_1236227 [Paraphaeosphaeria sporulosa]
MAPRPSTPGVNPFAPSGCVPPTQTVALALAIVKATPPGIPARGQSAVTVLQWILTNLDYVLKLRAHLKLRRQMFTESEQNRYLDLVSYWQQRCETAEHECKELNKKIASLERSVHCLGNLTVRPSNEGEQLSPSPSKKKGPTSAAAKRPRNHRLQAANPPAPDEILEDDLQLLEKLGNHGTTVAQHYWTAQKLLRRPGANVDSICGSVVGIASALGQIFPIIAKNHDRLAVRTVDQPHLRHIGQSKSELSCLMSACARAWTLVIVALDRLEEDSPGSRRSGLVIFECVKLVSAALDAIRLSARHAAWKKGSSSAQENIHESIGARSIAHLLATFIGHLEKDSGIHHKLFDGIAYVLLERVGDQLYYCTFERERGATIEERITPKSKSTDPHEVARQATDAAAIRLEVKALVIILERVMGVAPLHSNEQVAKKSKTALARTVSLKNISSTRIKLSSLAQERLQRTLIQCTFGHQVDDDFKDILTKPVSMGRAPPAPKVTDADVPEWYQAQVWRLVGWEILEKDGEWLG